MKIVLFSGGCDSTLVLNNLALESFKNNDRIIAFSVNNDQLDHNFLQRSARERIKSELNKRSLINIDFIEIELKTITGEGLQQTGLLQPLMWIPTVLLYCPSNTSIDIYCGYHKGDDFWIIKDKIQTIIELYSKILEKITPERIVPKRINDI